MSSFAYQTDIHCLPKPVCFVAMVLLIFDCAYRILLIVRRTLNLFSQKIDRALFKPSVRLLYGSGSALLPLMYRLVLFNEVYAVT